MTVKIDLGGERYKTLLYYTKDRIHRICYFYKSRFHNEEGPAITEYSLNGEVGFTWYYLHGKRCTTAEREEIEYNKEFNEELEELLDEDHAGDITIT